jgi:NAD/NADP transhydrogenase alpha subunit
MHLVADLLEVLAQLDDRVVCVGCLDGVGVVGDEERLCGLVCDDADLALREHVSTWICVVKVRMVACTFFALSESSVDSMVMYFSPLILTPFEMTALGSLLSAKEAAIALISAAVSWRLLAYASLTASFQSLHLVRDV